MPRRNSIIPQIEDTPDPGAAAVGTSVRTDVEKDTPVILSLRWSKELDERIYKGMKKKSYGKREKARFVRDAIVAMLERLEV